MNYAHIIYNSSEKGRTGSVGFSVRSATEGTPWEVLKAMEDNGVFSFTEAGPSLSPAMLAQKPELILQIPPTYFFRIIPTSPSVKAYIIGRAIAVGFDYTFYINGKPGRLGNYVVDCYAFTQCPTAKEFEIFLENAAPGSNHFIPASPVPSPDNNEMAEISIGHKPDLPFEANSFEASGPPALQSDVLDLLFAFIRGRKEDKPVLVKSPIDLSPKLMAALASICPENRIEDLTFISNYHKDGKTAGINIVFINEYYTREVFPKQWITLDLLNHSGFASPEAQVFRPMIEQALASGNLRDARNIISWLLSPLYEQSKNFKSTTQNRLYSYIYNYQAFNPMDLTLDSELKNAIHSHLLSVPADKQRLADSIEKWYESIDTPEGLYPWFDYLLAVRPIEFPELIDDLRNALTAAMLEDEMIFRNFYNRYKNNFHDILKYLNPVLFPKYESYLSGYRDSDWEKLYPLFLNHHLNDKEYIVHRLISDRVGTEVKNRIISTIFTSEQDYMETLISMLTKDAGDNEGELILCLQNVLCNNPFTKPDFFSLFSSHIDDPYYYSLFLWQLEHESVRNFNDIKRITGYLDQIKSNSEISQWARTPNATIIFGRILDTFKQMYRENSLKPADFINFYNWLSTNYSSAVRIFIPLYNVLYRKTDLYNQELQAAIEMAKDINDKEYLRLTSLNYLKSIEDGNPNELYNQIHRMLDENLITTDRIIEGTRNTKKVYYYYIGMLNHLDKKPQEQLDFLLNDCGLPEPQAMQLLERSFPKSHHKILKSREPSVGEKMGKFFKGMFAKKDNFENQDN